MRYSILFTLLTVTLVLAVGCSNAAEKPLDTLPAPTGAESEATSELTIDDATPPEEESVVKQANYAEIIVPYDSYDAFEEMMKKRFPDKFCYRLPEDSGLQIDKIELHDDAFYTFSFSGNNGEHAYMEVLMYSTFDSVEELQKAFGGVNADSNTFQIADPHFLFEHYSNNVVALIGLAGEQQCMFNLLNTAPDKPEDMAEQEQALVNLYQQLGL